MLKIKSLLINQNGQFELNLRLGDDESKPIFNQDLLIFFQNIVSDVTQIYKLRNNFSVPQLIFYLILLNFEVGMNYQDQELSEQLNSSLKLIENLLKETGIDSNKFL